MRKLGTAVALVALLAVAPVTPAGAGRSQTAYASISRVQPEFVAIGEDDYGTYCLFRAAVTLSWAGSIRLWTSQFVDGQRQTPGELALKGSGTKVTVVVEGIGVRHGGVGPLVAEAQVLAKRTWVIIDSEASREAVTCPPSP